MKKLIAVAILLLTTGCASQVVNTRSDGNSDIAGSAVITCAEVIEIISVDDDTDYSVYSGGGLFYKDCIILLEPGIHTITSRLNSGGGPVQVRSGEVTLKGKFEAGTIYRIDYDKHAPSWSPFIYKLQGNELKTQQDRIMETMHAN